MDAGLRDHIYCWLDSTCAPALFCLGAIARNLLMGLEPDWASEFGAWEVVFAEATQAFTPTEISYLLEGFVRLPARIRPGHNGAILNCRPMTCAFTIALMQVDLGIPRRETIRQDGATSTWPNVRSR